MHAKHSQMSASRPRRRRISLAIFLLPAILPAMLVKVDSEMVVGGGKP